MRLRTRTTPPAPGSRPQPRMRFTARGDQGQGDEARYRELVDEALDYRIDVVNRTLVVLGGIKDSKLRHVHRQLEADSQEIWGRRRALEASDLVRFGLTYRWWRNAQVDILEADVTCAEQVTALGDVGHATDRAKDAGVRQLAIAEVVGLDPLRLDVKSRRLGAGKRVVALHVAGRPVVEDDTTTVVVMPALPSWVVSPSASRSRTTSLACFGPQWFRRTYRLATSWC